MRGLPEAYQFEPSRAVTWQHCGQSWCKVPRTVDARARVLAGDGVRWVSAPAAPMQLLSL